MNDFLLVLTGAGISLVSSVTVTWLQARYTRRGDVRESTRSATRRLTSLFIAERDAADSTEESTAALAEAELLAMTITERRARERLRDLTRLLRELRLPELRELSGVRSERARWVLCDHALEVLGALYRGERLPAVPPQVQKMLSVEDEALSIHAGEVSAPAVRTAEESAEAEPTDVAPRAQRTEGGSISKSAVPRRPRRATKPTRDKGGQGGAGDDGSGAEETT
ncbi:hypothetical protein GCM10009799_01710 [Nocardiopsis rhodophaea]|uniref:Secreted protein n=1 Tax=Nocardiopsis rhodophaea TaxID=280238 RepID=A0ABN2S4R3_9ACTN